MQKYIKTISLFLGGAITILTLPAFAQDAANELPDIPPAAPVEVSSPVAPASAPMPVATPAQTPDISLITPAVVDNIRGFVNTEIVRLSIINQNIKYGNISQQDIDRLDQQWRAETKAESQPLIASTLSNPLSTYLTRIQAHSAGLYTEIFVMDKNGLNIGQSNISSDYWQGDEAKFQKTFPIGPNAVFIDEPELNEELGQWRTQVNLAIADETETQAIGAITVEVNLTELQRRRNAR